MDGTKKLREVVTGIYLLCVFAGFPYYVTRKYERIGQDKYEYYMTVTILLLISLLGLWLYERVVKNKRQLSFSFLDCCVCAYGVCAGISYLFAVDHTVGLSGAGDWHMGLFAQLSFVLLYFAVERNWEYHSYTYPFICFFSGGVFLLGILHRFYVDPLGLYQGLDERYVLSYLSTIGQATWYSSFLCVVFPIGLYLFWEREEKRIRLWMVLYLLLAFGTLVTQNSDSAFAALGILLLILFWKAFENRRNWERFWQVLMLFSAACLLLGSFQRIFAYRAVKPGALSVFMTQGKWNLLLLLVAFLCYLRSIQDKREWNGKTARKIRNGCFLCLAMVFLLLLLGIALNTQGLSAKWLEAGLPFQELLYFNDSWGNRRGFIWRISVELFQECSLLQKIFGVGPDCYGAFAYSHLEIAEELNSVWGDRRVLCAHSEPLNSLICYGIAGSIAYYSIFFTALYRYIKKSSAMPDVFAVALCLASYLGHNLFCYQQVCCTPFLFILLGIAEGILKSCETKA